jgi:putative spermidine/putrescine transport system substrate-binding protein
MNEHSRDPQAAAINRTGWISRRDFLKAAGGAAAVAGGMAPWVTTRAQQGGTLNVVLNQGLLAKLWIDELHPAYEKETGAKVNVQQSVTANMLAMLRTQRDNPPDLMQFSEAGVFVAADEGLLRPHNPANIPNFAFLRPAFRLADNYSAGVVDAVNTIYYNTAQQKVAPKSWAEMWQAPAKGRIAIPPITWNSGVRMVTSAAQVATGKPMKEAQYDLDAGMRQLARLKEQGVLVFTGAPQAIQMLQSGTPPLVPFYGLFINPIVDQGAPIWPATQLAEGKHGEIVGLNMPAKARNVELVERYVNMSLSRPFQEKVDTVLRSLSAHRDVNPSPRTRELLGPTDNITYADWKFLSKNRAKLTESWNAVFG